MEFSLFFLVYYDDHHGNLDTEGRYQDGFVRWLKDHKFSCAARYWGCPWYFVDIEHKKFKPGRPGLCYGKVICEHAITFEEFKVIYVIYHKYEGLEVLQFE